MPNSIRRFLLIASTMLLFVGLVYLGVDWWLREEPNYSEIEPGLYQGGLVDEAPRKVSAVLNLCEVEDSYHADVHLWLPIRDNHPAPSLEWLQKRVEFVEAQRKEGRGVFVHCAAGVSRSGMVTTAYLMKKYRWSRDQTLVFIRERRPQTRPNPAFMELLEEWEKKLLEGRE